jgi:DNA-binding transcriptional LysR family regulator
MYIEKLMNITLTQLEALRRVARTGSFSRAARSLHVTQPAVSQQLAALQRAVGFPLIEIVRRRPQLTDAGRFIAERAEAIGESLERLEREAREYARAERGTLHFAATLTIGTYVLPAALARFCLEHPNVVPQVEVMNTNAVADRVRSGDAHFGLVEGTIDEREFLAEPFGRDRLVLVVPVQGHRLSAAHGVRARELEGEAFVSREIGSGTRDLGYERLVERGVTPRIVLELPDGEGITRAVEAGLGVAILSELVVERAVAMGTVRTLPIADVVMDRYFWTIRARHHANFLPLAAAFVDELRKTLGAGETDARF